MKLRNFSRLGTDFTTPNTQQPLAEGFTKEIKDSAQWKVDSFKTISDTPVQNKKHYPLTGELNEQDNFQNKISPGLARLRMTPGSTDYFKHNILITFLFMNILSC